ncbi:class I SAM-dependent methyltransferase [Sedimentibacter sp.]|uniref:class I SAM-dependent DNA methyltransferase n=1 Tax=Sedimentibacter sp. TaxID=1960295 RepID=UPI0028AAEC2F|nr:class I SAM-dependent methyltransferase [Sedimentibacter sp.]
MITIEHSWDRMAEAYEQFTSGEDSYSSKIEWPCIQKMLPDLSEKSVIDLGCGTGRFTFLLENKNPAKIIGIDLSDDMLKLAKAKAKKIASTAVFYKGDISKSFTDEKFDFIFSSTVSHYIKDLNKLFSNIYDMLKPDGICVISAMNPVYTSQYPISKDEDFPDDSEWTVRYLDRRERSYIQPWIEYNSSIENFLSSSYHHTFSDYINSMIQCGFSIMETQEPLPPEEWMENCLERYNAFIETPKLFDN